MRQHRSDSADLGDGLTEHGQQTPGHCGDSAAGSAASPAFSHGRTGRPEKEAVSFVSRGYRECTAAHNSQASLQEHASDAAPDAVVNTDDTPYRFKVSSSPSSPNAANVLVSSL
jgi:hypothetical protein